MKQDTVVSKDGITINVPMSTGKGYTVNAAQDIAVDEHDLHRVMAEHSGRFSWWATVYELALSQSNTLEHEMEILEAKIDGQIRKAWKKDADGKLTEKFIDRQINGDKRYIDAKRRYLKAKEQAGVLKAQRDAWVQRKDMIVSLSIDKRHELDGDIAEKARRIAERQEQREQTVQDIYRRELETLERMNGRR